MEPREGGEKPRRGREGEFMTRSREAELAMGNNKKKEPTQLGMVRRVRA
jgi:hypothetical protein